MDLQVGEEDTLPGIGEQVTVMTQVKLLILLSDII